MRWFFRDGLEKKISGVAEPSNALGFGFTQPPFPRDSVHVHKSRVRGIEARGNESRRRNRTARDAERQSRELVILAQPSIGFPRFHLAEPIQNAATQRIQSPHGLYRNTSHRYCRARLWIVREMEQGEERAGWEPDIERAPTPARIERQLLRAGARFHESPFDALQHAPAGFRLWRYPETRLEALRDLFERFASTLTDDM